MRKSLLTSWALLAVLLTACQKTEPVTLPAEDPGTGEEPVVEPQPQKPQPGTYTLPLMETTDIHGYIVNLDNTSVQYRLANVASHVERLRQKGKDRLLLLDGGDLYQGASISNLMSGWPIYVAADRMGYDAVALGNHEFDWGLENMVDADATLPDYYWNDRECVNTVPVLCANLFHNGARETRTQDYVIVEKSAVNAQGAAVPVKIGIVGFAVDYAGSIITTQFIGKGYSIQEDYALANRLASGLEASGQCDATVLLIHGAADAAAAHLGKGSAIDLVLGGHSHRTMCGRSEGGIPYLQGGRYCEHYAYGELRFRVDEEGAVTFTGAEDLKTASVNPAGTLSEDIVAVSDYALAACEQEQKDVIGYIKVGATSYYLNGSGERAAVISNWMCDILRRIGEADVAFVNSGGIRTSLPLNGQSRRDITVANVYEMFPFSNPTYVYKITYAELLRVFDYAMTSGGQSLFSRMTGIDCYFTETDHGSYSTYSVHSLSKDGTVIYQNGRWTGDWASRTVLLAVSEYLATTERTDYYTNLSNPLTEWNGTSRLLSSDRVDNVSAVQILREEAAASGGLLSIDTSPHFLLR